MNVTEISKTAAMEMVMQHHYSQRKVGSVACFGLFDGKSLCGCCVFSIPASYTLCRGVCGPAYSKSVWELSRLVITTEAHNAASRLIGQSMRRIGDKVLVSYADCNDHVGHVGYVYQATNWIYTGRGNAEPKWIDPRSGKVISYTRRHIDRKADSIGLRWQDLVKEAQVGKHRYVTFAGTKAFRRKARKALRYTPQPYPKGASARHFPVSKRVLPLFGE